MMAGFVGKPYIPLRETVSKDQGCLHAVLHDCMALATLNPGKNCCRLPGCY